MPLVTLLLIQGPDQGQRYEFTQDEITIGRGAVNDIQLHDTESSRRHAFMRWTDTDGWRITDEGSSNGTFVRLGKEQLVQRGDVLLMGQQLFRVDF